MKKNSIAIIHYRDINLYPPTLNILDYFNNKKLKYLLVYNKEIKSENSKGSFYFISKAIYFILKSLFTLFRTKGQILCFESISITPVFIYFVLIPWSRRNVIVHCHEYISKNSYSKQSRLDRLGYFLQKYILKRVSWFSHTNRHRLNAFQDEYKDIPEEILRIFPNYPPMSWDNDAVDEVFEKNEYDLRFLHIGSLSMKGQYICEFLNVFGNNPAFKIDFYSHSLPKDVEHILFKHKNCSYMGAIDYYDIPKLKGSYDVGLVLYKGLTNNFKYNAPNKLFEYWACGLDVWFSSDLITSHDYINSGVFPSVKSVDFKKLEEFNWKKNVDRSMLNYEKCPYNAESVVNVLYNFIIENN